MPEEYIRDLRRRYQEAPEGGLISDVHRLFGGPKTRPEIRREAEGIAPILNLDLAHGRAKQAQETEDRKARTAQQKQMMDLFGLLNGEIKDFQGRSVEEQTRLRPAMTKKFLLYSSLLTDPETKQGPWDKTDVEGFFSIPDYSDMMLKTADPTMRAELQDSLRAQLRTVPPGPDAAAKRHEILKNITAAHEQEVTDNVKRGFALIPKRADGQPLTREDVRAFAKKNFPGLSSTPGSLYPRVLEAVLADDKFLADQGIRTGAAAAAKQVATETAMGGLTAEVTTGKAEQAGAVSVLIYPFVHLLFIRISKRIDKEQQGVIP